MPQRHRHVEWLKFLRRIERQTPAEKEPHLIADNYATHKHRHREVARQTTALLYALHADLGIVAEHR